MEQVTAYKFSKGIRQAKKRYITLAIIFPILLIAFTFLSPMSKGLSPTFLAGIGIFALVVMGSSIYFSASRALRNLSELSVYIFPDRLERQGKRHKETFFWKDMVRADIHENPRGETVSIKLSFLNKRVIELFGFDDMEAARHQIAQYIPNQDLIHQKRARINWNTPAGLLFLCTLPLVIILAIQVASMAAYQFFLIILFFITGLYVWIARPISVAQGKGWEKLEMILGILLIVCSIFLLVIQLLIVLVQR
jgi:hypothetical protein